MENDIQQQTDLQNETSNESQAMTEILNWSINCPLWQRDALRRICQTGDLDATDIEELTDLCKNGGQGANPLEVDHIRTPDVASNTVKLLGIHGTENVNALKDGQHLNFRKSGMTVIYGNNGSGKSSYIRILKQVCRARTLQKEKEILSNIYTSKSVQQKAYIDYIVNGEKKCEEWMPQKPACRALSSISVFDSQAANIHVEEENEVAYTPFPMKVLEKLVEACQKVRGNIDTEIQNLKQRTPSTISNPNCAPSTTVGNLFSGLSVETNKDDVRKLAKLDDEENLQFIKLSYDLNNDPKLLARQVQLHKTQLENFNSIMNSLCDNVSEDRICRLDELHRNYQIAKEAAEIAANNLFKLDPLPEIGSDVWRKLWEAARVYSDKYAYKKYIFPFVSDSAKCVLCQQELGEGAAKRMVRFEKFIKDDIKQNEEYTRNKYETELNKIKNINISIEELSTVRRLVIDELNDEKLAFEIRRCVIILKLRQRTIVRSLEAGISVVLPPMADILPTDAIDEHIVSLDRRIDVLLAEDESNERKDLRKKYDELSSRKYLADVLEDVLEEIDRKIEQYKLESVSSDTKTYPITKENSRITEKLVTQFLRAGFSEELDKFGINDLAIELRRKSKHGVPRFFISFIDSPHKAAEMILSEGEHRCVALAAFMAEISTTQGHSAIVFDDPVTSLDHNYREKISERLTLEAQKRQVVVFTHEVAFMLLIQNKCKDMNTQLSLGYIEKFKKSTGIVHCDPPLHAQGVDEVIRGLQQHLNNVKNQYEKGELVEWDRTARDMIFRLRHTWERAIEQFVAPVFKRMSNKVTPGGLYKLTILTEDDSETALESYGRCSKHLHSSADALMPKIPTLDDIQYEISELSNWVQNIENRQDKIKPASNRK